MSHASASIPLLSALVVALGGCVGVGEVRTLGRYDFSYRIEGDARAAPLQIFDDGRQTYFQFRERSPAIFGVGQDGKPVVLTARRDNQYVIAEAIEREFVFLLEQDQARATGTYIGQQNRSVLPHELPGLPQPEPAPATDSDSGILSRSVPFQSGSARINDAARSEMEALLPQAVAARRIVILARPAHKGDRRVGAGRAKALRNWFARRGVKRGRILIVTGIALAPDYAEVMISAPQTTKAPDVVVARPQRREAIVFGAAQPLRVSMPARPVFVDRSEFRMRDASFIVR